MIADAPPAGPPWYLTGPTASGKTILGIALAERLGGEIVAMDSMSLYRDMDILTAKPPPAERRRVPHHLIDVLDPWEECNLAQYLDMAQARCREIAARGRRVLFVGGTGLYLKALLRGIFQGSSTDPDVRGRLERELAERGPRALHAELAGIDPDVGRRIHPNDARRVVRALEVARTTGQPISQLQQQFGRPAPAGSVVLAIDLPRPRLYARIDQRVERMFQAGLVDEVRRLQTLARPVSRSAAQALGYKETLRHLSGDLTRDQAIEWIRRRSRQFAKRQLTWFRHLDECRMVALDPDEPVEPSVSRLLAVAGQALGDARK